jgi:hypothetical protein
MSVGWNEHLDCIPFACNRQLNGEDLEGLNIDELQKLEKEIEGGLSRVLQAKVFVNKFIS